MSYSPSGRGPEVIATFAVFMALSTIVTVLRVYVRTSMIRCFGLDDWLSVLGCFLFIVQGAFAIAGAFHGTGQHANLIPASEIPIGLKWWWLCEPIYVICNMAVKLSIALMLLRFTVERIHKVLVYTVTGILQLYSVAFFFIFLFQCLPPSAFWTRFQGESGTCMNPHTVIISVYVYSAITCLYDGTMAILPWILVRNIQMNKRTKWMVTVVLGLGSIASVATIVRIPYIHSLANTGDFLFSTSDVAVWSACETGLSIVASSAATLKPLFKGLANRSSQSRTSRSDNGTFGSSRANYVRSESEISIEEGIRQTTEVTVKVEDRL